MTDQPQQPEQPERPPTEATTPLPPPPPQQPPPPPQPPAAPPGYSYSPTQMTPADERTWSLMAHLGALVFLLITGGLLGWLAPLIVMMVKGNDSRFVRAHSVESLNFQITVLLVWVVGGIASVLIAIATLGLALIVLIPLAIAYFIFVFVVLILASVRANEGQVYRYPLTLRMVN